MKLLLKLIEWANKRRFARLKAAILKHNGARERVLFLATELEKELIENYELKPQKSNSNVIFYDFIRFSETDFKVSHNPEDQEGFITINSIQ